MGAKQSKRSVDISGKEAESAGEVAAAGAGGEGRVEQLADADALKPQLNGDAHIHEQTEKEKELDSGTPENEKDATTEKEAKQEDETNAPVTNGETEQKAENCDTTPVSEDGKKPKKEKVKKKWSLRSISFSRKDKPKQEKKQKEEESKTNGEPEKVPEETAEIPPESSAVEATEDIKTEIEPKEEKTPETPVTEPITNGSFTPESVKADTPVTLVTEEPVDTNPEIDRPEAKIETEPEQLPVNGLTLEEPAKENIEVQKVEESKPEEPKTETTEIALDIPVKKEVCVDQMPLIEPTPPPLPANPPPSSVASFAATTMAPELTDASLANTADTAISSLSADINIKDNINDILLNPRNVPSTETVTIQLPPPVRESSEDSSVSVIKNEQGSKQTNSELENSITEEVLSSEHEIQDTKFEDEVDKIIIDNIDIKNDIENAVTPVLPEVIEIAQKTYELPIVTEDNKIAAVSENSKVQVSDITEVSVSKMLVPEISKVQVPEVPEVPVSETPEVPIRDIEMPIPAIQEVLVPQISEIPVPDVSKVPEPEILETPDISELPIHKIPDVAVSKFHEVPVLEISVVQVPEIPEVPVPAISESRATDVTELPVPELLNDNKSNIQLVHMPIAPVEDLEYIPTVLDVEGELPSPPPPICDDTDNVSIRSNEINEKVDNVQEAIHDLKETMINSNHILETEEIVVSFDKENNDNKQTLQNKVQESYGDQIQTTECNGNIVYENMVSTEESTHNETPDDKASKENLNEENGRTVPPVECASVPNAEAGDSLAPSRAAPLATAQEPLPAIDKTITEMIPEVPVVPEINTETETTTDVAVAN